MQHIVPAEVYELLNIWPDACAISGCLKASCTCIFCKLELSEVEAN